MAIFEDITLRENNLYGNGKIIEFTEEGEAILVRKKLVYVGEVNDLYHVLKEGEPLGKLASMYYKGTVPDPSKYWWAIADANNIQNPLDIADLVGTELLIPDILKVKLILEPA